jgi:hypothetical protein
MDEMMNYIPLSILTFIAVGTTLNATNKKPNIILIMTDDVGYGDISCYGGKVPTPFVDKLAA